MGALSNPLMDIPQKCFIWHGNSRVQIEEISEKHGAWLDEVGYKLDYVTIT